MKTLIFNGSPRKNGNTMVLINKLRDTLHGSVKIINAYEEDIAPCNDCRHCWSNEGCIINDGMNEIYRDVEEADNIVIASPIYYCSLTGPLLSLLSRLQIYFAAHDIRKEPVTLSPKNGVLMLTSGGSGGIKGAQKTADVIFSMINTKRIATILTSRTDSMPAAAETQAHEEIRIAALKLNSLSAK